MNKPSDHLLFAEFDDLLRTLPDPGVFFRGDTAGFEWVGRFTAALNAWDPIIAIPVIHRIETWMTVTDNWDPAQAAHREALRALHRAKNDLRLRSVGPSTLAFDQGRVFDYFDELRKVIESARSDLLFVDAFMNAEFASRYLVHVAVGVTVRLLANQYAGKLLQATQLLQTQQGITIQVRTTSDIHDRYVFVDATECYQSGASFKDGARKVPTTLTQVLDAFQPIRAMYEGLWQSSAPVN